MSSPSPFGAGGAYQSPTGGPPFGAPPPAQQSPALAIASLACGILGILLSCCCGLFAIPLPLIAIGLGAFAMMSPSAGGKPMAIGGIICGVLAIVLVILSVIIALSNPEFMRQFQQMQNR